MIKIDVDFDIPKVEPPETIESFVKVPKEIILAKDLPVQRISTFLYFDYNKTKQKTVHYTSKYMIEWSGYKPTWNRSNKDNIYEKFKTCMNWFFENEYIYDFDVKKFSQTRFQSSYINHEKLSPSNNFGILYDFEIDAINKFESNYKPISKSSLLLILSYIRAYTWTRVNALSGHSDNSRKEKPEVLCTTFKEISNYTGITPKIVSRITDILEKMNLTRTCRPPRFQDSSGKWHTEKIIYACPYKYELFRDCIQKAQIERYSCANELIYGMEFLKNNMYQSKKFYQD